MCWPAHYFRGLQLDCQSACDAGGQPLAGRPSGRGAAPLFIAFQQRVRRMSYIKGSTAQLSAVLAAVLLSFLSVSVSAQTLTLNDGSILRKSPSRIGLNIGAIDYWDNGQILKNLIGSTNPGFEPLLDQQIWALTSAGSTSAFTIPDKYDTVPPNYWAGGAFSVVESQSGGAERVQYRA